MISEFFHSFIISLPWFLLLLLTLFVLLVLLPLLLYLHQSLKRDRQLKVRASTIKTLQYGFAFQTKELFPLCNHYRHVLFKEEKVRDTIKESLVDVFSHNIDTISGQDENEFTRNYERKVGANAKVELSTVAKAEFRALHGRSEAVGNSGSKIFSQTRVQVSKKFLKLVTKPFASLDDAREFLEEEAFRELTSIRSVEDAVSFTRKYGLFYIKEAHLGGLRIYESDGSKSTQNDAVDSLNALGFLAGLQKLIPAGLGFGLAGSNSTNEQRRQSNQRATALGKTVGGNTSLLTDASNTSTWMESISEDNLEICQCWFLPIYYMLPQDGPTELTQPRVFLRNAYYKALEKDENNEKKININNNSLYAITNEFYGEISDLNCARVRECYHKNQQRNPLGSNEMLVALELLDSGEIFGRKKRLHKQFPTVKKKAQSERGSDTTDEDNQWILKEILNTQKPQNSLLILSASGREMLGVKDKNYVFRKYSKWLENLNEKFMWSFRRWEENKASYNVKTEAETIQAESNLLGHRVNAARGLNGRDPTWKEHKQK